MQKTTRKLILSVSISGILIIACSMFLVSYAQSQKSDQGKNNVAEPENNARREVEKSVMGNLFLDSVMTKDSTWNLKKAYFSAKNSNDESSLISMSFGKGVDFVNVSIQEFSSADEAVKAFHLPRSYGGSAKLDGFGDEGEKVFGQNGDFIALNFQKGNYSVNITTTKEKTAERFAGYALEMLNNLSGN